MAHEQSETIQLPSGKWANVYGRKTRKAGQRLPDSQEFDTVEDAVKAARERSEAEGVKEERRRARERRNRVTD